MYKTVQDPLPPWGLLYSIYHPVCCKLSLGYNGLTFTVIYMSMRFCSCASVSQLLSLLPLDNTLVIYITGWLKMGQLCMISAVICCIYRCICQLLCLQLLCVSEKLSFSNYLCVCMSVCTSVLQGFMIGDWYHFVCYKSNTPKWQYPCDGVMQLKLFWLNYKHSIFQCICQMHTPTQGLWNFHLY